MTRLNYPKSSKVIAKCQHKFKYLPRLKARSDVTIRIFGYYYRHENPLFLCSTFDIFQYLKQRCRIFVGY